jgi:diguanylate cyclase (GGDEF)-like protein
LGSTHVLVVDDEASVRTGLVALLREWGYEADCADNGEAALDALTRSTWQVLVVDIRMPGMDGLELLREARVRGADCDVIVITAYDMDYSYLDVVEAGATDFITKPFRAEELRAKLHRILRERRLRQQLVELSIRDGLTRLYNRRHFHSKLENETLRARRQGHSLALVLLDVDDLKSINDTHGHVEGDAVLVGLAGVLESSLRFGVDLAFRLGGDEFAVLLIDSDLAAAHAVAERIRSSVQALGEPGRSLSLGIAALEQGDSSEDLLRRADNALYHSKRSGGNRVTSLEPA